MQLISIWSVAIPMIVGLILIKQLHTQSKLVLSIVLVAAIPQVLTNFIEQAQFLNGLYNIYTPIEFVLIYFLLAAKLTNKIFCKIKWILVGIFMTGSVAIIIAYGINNRFLNEWVCIANLCYLCWAFMYILECLMNTVELLDFQLPMFWYLSGLIIYTPCTALVFSFYYYIGKTPFIKNLWIIHNIFNTLLYLFFAMGFYTNFRQNAVLKR